MNGRAVAALSALLTVAGCREALPKQPRNDCQKDSDCDPGAICEPKRKLCFLEEVAVPYTLTIQVTAQRGGGQRLQRQTFDRILLSKSRSDLDLSIPSGMSVTGFVGTQDGGDREPLEAEVTFTPVTNQEGLPVSIVTTNSKSVGMDSNVQATLAPNTRYMVKVTPLGTASRRVPPGQLSVDTGRSDRFELVYPALETFTGIIVDEAMKPAKDRWVRIVSTEDDEVRSSIGIVDATGAVSLFVEPGVLAGDNYRFEVALDTNLPFESALEIDPARINTMARNTITIPEIPRLVTYTGFVEESEDVDARLAGTELTFVSDFPIPDTPGEVGDRDFCRSTILGDTLPAFKCRSTRRTTTDEDGRFSLPLLPGDYRVFLSPPKEGDVNRATTQQSRAVIATQPANAPQQGQVYRLTTGARYPGAARAPDGSKMQNVAVRAIALGLPAMLGPLSDVAPYNRSSEALTDDTGRFVLAVDPGYYDLVARPPVTSGFGWAYVRDVLVSTATADVSLGPLTFLFRTPVLLAGTLESDGEPEPMASIDAYAIVEGARGKRALLIGQATTDAEGRYSLLLPAEILDGQDSPLVDAGSE